MKNLKSLFVIFGMVLFAGCGGNKPTENTENEAVQEEIAEVPSTPEVVGEEVSYQIDGQTLKGYLAYDKNQKGPRPGILVVHEWWGHDEYTRSRARQLAELGYTALAVDMYGDGKTADHPDDAGKFSQEVFSNIEVGMARFNAGVELLKEHETTNPAQIAAIGYCFGGGIVLHMARSGADLNGVVSFHGSLGTQSPAQEGTVKAAVLVCHGADDPFVKPEDVEAIKVEMSDAGVDFTFKSYEGAVHSFTNPEADERGKKFELPLAYNQAADEQSWAEMQMFFERVFAEDM